MKLEKADNMIDQYQISLKVLLKNKEGKILLLRPDPKSTWGQGGFYDLPGGRIDEEEFTTNFEKILTREIKEECGEVDVRIYPQPIGLGRHAITKTNPNPAHWGKHVLYVVFGAELLSGDVATSNEHVGHEWVSLDGMDLEKYFTSGILEGVKMYLRR